MNIMILMGLANVYKAKTYLLPMLKIKEIERIHIIRDIPFYNHDKVSFHSPPKKLIKNPILKTIYKFVLSILIILKNDIDLIYGIQMFPHGIITWLLSRIFSKKYVFAVISGDGEIHSKINFVSFLARKAIREANFLMLEGSTKEIVLKTEIPDFLYDLGISEEKILPGYSSCFTTSFFPTNSESIWDIITITRLHKIKRINIFINIIEKVNKIKKLKCAIIGDGPMEASLKKMVKKKNLQNVIEFLGEIPNNKLNKYYNQSEIFLLTSKNEGLPATIIEAMLTETCTISADVGAISTCIKHGENGFLFSPYNYSESILLIIKLLENKDILNKTAKNGRETALKYSAWNRIKTWENIVHECMKHYFNRN